MAVLTTKLKYLYFKNIIFYGPIDRVYKYNKINPKRIDAVQRRLQFIKKNRFKLLQTLYDVRPVSNSCFRLNQEWIFGDTINKFEMQHQEIKNIIYQLGIQLLRLNFTHGDISPSNVVIRNKTAYLIDYLIDLNSRSGTPQTSTTLCALGIHNKFTDLISLHKILNLYKI